MNKNQYVEYYNDLGKFKELHVEGLFCKNESEGANGNLPFFVCNWIYYKYYLLFINDTILN